MRVVKQKIISGCIVIAVGRLYYEEKKKTTVNADIKPSLN